MVYKVSPQAVGEDKEAYLIRILLEIDHLNQAEWKALPDSVREWSNTAMLAFKAKRPLPDLPLVAEDTLMSTAKRSKRPPPSNERKMTAFLHCGRCVAEFKSGSDPTTRGESMATWARLSVGWTPIGLQVWCERHQSNVMHIDFEGQKHPANVTAKLDA